nr:MAG TPA_asm: hypothetical protein [Caudoviricetes sp.]
MLCFEINIGINSRYVAIIYYLCINTKHYE